MEAGLIAEEPMGTYGGLREALESPYQGAHLMECFPSLNLDNLSLCCGWDMVMSFIPSSPTTASR